MRAPVMAGRVVIFVPEIVASAPRRVGGRDGGALAAVAAGGWAADALRSADRGQEVPS